MRLPESAPGRAVGPFDRMPNVTWRVALGVALAV